MGAPHGLHIGTSGWHYRHWSGPFYPPDCRPESFLEHYAERFDTTEINSTFYRLPARETLDAWRDGSPAGFVFACKAGRYITHMKKLRDPAESIGRFFSAIEALGPKLGPVLFQLPPRWRANPARLKTFLGALPRDHFYAFEFRDPSWFVPEIYDLLAERNAAFCLYDLAGRRTPLRLTASFVYLRFHGPREAYRGSYDPRTLASWARRILTWRKDGLAVYGYFNNDWDARAVENAGSLRRLLVSSGAVAPGAGQRE